MGHACVYGSYGGDTATDYNVVYNYLQSLYLHYQIIKKKAYKQRKNSTRQ